MVTGEEQCAKYKIQDNEILAERKYRDPPDNMSDPLAHLSNSV